MKRDSQPVTWQAIAFAVAVGLVLVLAADFLAGVSAALPLPRGFFAELNPWTGLGTFASMLLTYQAPVAVMAALASWAMFRALRSTRPTLVLACMTPWLAMLMWHWLGDLRGSFDSVTSNGFFALSALVGMLFVPAGIWAGAQLANWRMRSSR